MDRTNIKQRDITDCGAACLASVAAYHRLQIPVARIRLLASTDKRGTNILGLVQAATKLGFDAKGVRGPLESLKDAPLPAIAHLVVRDVLHHFIVIYKISSESITIMDPATGKREVNSLEAFRAMWTGVLVLLMPNDTFNIGNLKRSLPQTLWQLIRPHRYIVMQALIGALIYTLIGLSTSIYIQIIVDYVFLHQNRNLLNLISIMMLALLTVQVFIHITKSILTLQTGQSIDRKLILGYYQHLLKLPQSFFDTMRTGEIISRINDAVKIRLFINEAMLNLSVNVFVVVLSFSLMFLYNMKLSLLMVACIPFYGVIYLVTSRLNRQVERKIMEQSADLESRLVESIQSMRTIKSFGLEGIAHANTAITFDRLLTTLYKSGMNGIFSSSTTDLLSRVFTILLFWTGSALVLRRELTPGELLSFYALIGYFTGPVTSLIGMNKIFQNAFIAADRLFEIMDLEQEPKHRGVAPEGPLTRDIVFKDITFNYGSRAAVFSHLHLTIPAGKITAFVGESGSGKSTLMALLQNLYSPSSGSILLGDYAISQIEQAALRRYVGVVPQVIDLFAGNVLDNICPGEDEPDMQRVIQLCADLGMNDFVEKLPGGLNTYLGENGVTLSGGQKQRLAIARALYREPEILILDEATSSLDSVAEKCIQKVIVQYRDRGKTIILIAHRLSSVLGADKIVVLDNGMVAEEGSHAELLAKQGKYRQLWRYQFPDGVQVPS